MTRFNDTLSAIAEKEPDIKSVLEFDRFAKQHFSENVSHAPPTSVPGKQPVEHNFSLISPLDLKIKGYSDIRGQISRPGMKPALNPRSKSSLINDPSEINETFEERREGAITFSVARKMAQDPAIALGMFLITGMVSGLRYTVKSSDPVMEGVISNVYRRHHNDIIRNCVKVALREGFVFGEKVYKRQAVRVTATSSGEESVIYDGPAIGISYINWIDPAKNGSRLRYFKSRTTGDIAYVQQWQSRSSTHVKVKRDKLFWFAIDKEFGNVFGCPRFQNAQQHWYYDDINYKYALNSLQKTGAPHIEARYPNGASLVGTQRIQNDELLAGILMNLTQTGVILLPSERYESTNELMWSVEYKEARNTGIDSWRAFSTYSDSKKLQAIGIPNGVLDSSTDSEADAKTDLLMVIVEDLVDQVESAIQSDLIDPLVEHNFGAEFKNQVSFTIDRSGLGRRKILKELLVNMMRIGATMPGYKMNEWPDAQKMMNELGLSTQSFSEVFSVDPLADQSAPAENEQKRNQQDEDSNDTDGHRLNPTERDPDRPAKEKSATDNN
jgi:hypothetical protein